MDNSYGKVATSEENQRIRDEFAQRLKEVYKNVGLKRKKFADAIGWDYGQLRSYDEARAFPPPPFFEAINSTYPSIDGFWLMTGVSREEAATRAQADDEFSPVRRIPVFDDIPASGFRDGVPETLEPIDYIYTTKLNDPTLFALKVKGDSMAPKIEHGDEAVCARSMDFVNGKIYAILVDGKGATLKCVYSTEDGFALVPLNPKYPAMPVKAEEIIEMYRVVMINKRVD